LVIGLVIGFGNWTLLFIRYSSPGNKSPYLFFGYLLPMRAKYFSQQPWRSYRNAYDFGSTYL
jgi:hypothetical protein